MPALNTSTITNAMHGGTQISAVYKGSVSIWISTPPDLPTPDGHMLAGPINMTAQHLPSSDTYRVWFYVPYNWMNGTDKPPTNRPSGFGYHPSNHDARYPDGSGQQGWFAAPSPTPINTVEVDGLTYVRQCIPREGAIGFTWNDTAKPFKLKVCVPFYDGTTPYPPTANMFSREQGLMFNNETYEASPSYKSNKLPVPIYP